MGCGGGPSGGLYSWFDILAQRDSVGLYSMSECVLDRQSGMSHQTPLGGRMRKEIKSGSLRAWAIRMRSVALSPELPAALQTTQEGLVSGGYRYKAENETRLKGAQSHYSRRTST